LTVPEPLDGVVVAMTLPCLSTARNEPGGVPRDDIYRALVEAVVAVVMVVEAYGNVEAVEEVAVK
jgi:hypothetical protein